MDRPWSGSARALIAAIPLVLLAPGSPVAVAQDEPAVSGDSRPIARDTPPVTGGQTSSAAPGGAPPAGGAIPLLEFRQPAGWVKVEVIDNVSGGCFLGADEAEARAVERIRDLGQRTEGDEDAFHVIFRVRATGDRTREGRCFGAIFFEELYPVDVVVRPGARPYRSRWPGRLGLQKLVLQEDAFDRDVLQVIEDGVRILFRER